MRYETAIVGHMPPGQSKFWRHSFVDGSWYIKQIEAILKVLDLFSGIGGFSLGLHRAGMQTVAFCEFDKHAQKILAMNWPEIPIYEDVRELTYERLCADGIDTIDLICGGFPCQDLSCAGKQTGWEGSRSSLYIEMLRLISECVPRYAIFENVSALLQGDDGRWFAKFLYDLAAVGYDAEWHCIPASAIGADHQRDRVWIIAYPAQNGNQELSESHSGKNSAGEKRAIFADKLFDLLGRERPVFIGVDSEPNLCRIVNGFPGGMDRLERLGNAVVPQIPEIIGKAIMYIEKENK